jgi:hypothetical protein
VLVAHRVNTPAFVVVVVVVVVPEKCGYLDVAADADAIARSIALFATFRPAICVLCCVVCVSLCTDDDDTNERVFFSGERKNTHTKEKEKKTGQKNGSKKKHKKKKQKKKGWTMDTKRRWIKKKVKKKKDRENNGHKKKEREKKERPKKKEASRRFRTRVEVRGSTKRTKNRYSSSLYAPLALSPQREEEEDEEVRTTSLRASLFVYVLFSREEKGCERRRTISESRVASRECRARDFLDAK